MSQNIVMIFDTETSGLPPKELHKQLDKLPSIVQLSFVLFDINENKIIKTYDKYIKQPETTDFNSQAFKITKITKSMCDNGVHIIEALMEFHTAYLNSNHIVAHNLDFDKFMIELEIIRNYEGLKQHSDFFGPQIIFNTTFNKMWNIQTYCTMNDGKYITKIELKSKFGKPFYKNPKLEELHKQLFSKTIDSSLLHNSLVDTLVCLKCYLKMKHNMDINIELTD